MYSLFLWFMIIAAQNQITEEMTEAAYEEKAAKLADILQMIRVK